jgi:hypothetical protein
MDFNNLLQRHWDLLLPYQSLWQKEPLSFYPQTYTGEIESWIDELQKFSPTQLISFESQLILPKSCSESLTCLINDIKKCINLISQDAHYSQLVETDRIGISQKKQHELAQVIKLLSGSLIFNDPTKIYDFGGGVGRVARILAKKFNCPVEVIDQNSDFVAIGNKSMAKLNLDERITFKQVFINQQSLDNYHFMPNSLFFGLHACGQLSVDLIKAATTHQAAILNYACCYHLISDYQPLSMLSKRLHILLTNDALHAAAKSYKPIDLEGLRKRRLVKLYRYPFHLYLMQYHDIKSVVSLGVETKKVAFEQFSDYALHFLKKLNLCPKLSASELNEFQRDTLNNIERLITVGSLRNIFARLIEQLIILDRCQYLKENDFQVKLVENFDRYLSPRNLGILAIKTNMPTFI